AIFDNRTVNLKREQVANHLQPGSASAGLYFAFGASIHKVHFGLFHENAADYLSVEQGGPFEGEIDALGGKERDGNVARGLADAHVLNRVSATPEVDLDFANVAGIERIAVQRPVHVIAHSPRQQSSSHARDDGDHDQDQPKSKPASSFAPLRSLPLCVRARALTGRF